MARIRTIKPELFPSQLARLVGAVNYGQFLIYRFYDGHGQLLYLGVTGVPEGRFAAHRRKSQWWPCVAGLATEICDGYRQSLESERAAIKRERPLFNRRSA